MLENFSLLHKTKPLIVGNKEQKKQAQDFFVKMDFMALSKNSIQASFELKRILKEQKITQYLTQYDYVSHLMLKDIQISYYLNDLRPHLFSSNTFKTQSLYLQQLKAFQKAKSIFVPSVQTRQDFLNIFPKLSRSKLEVTPFAYSDLPLNLPNTVLLKTLPPRSKFILTYSTLQPRDNLITLLRSLALQSSLDLPQLIVLLKIPKSRLKRKNYYTQKKEIQKFIKQRNLSNKVQLIENLPSFQYSEFYKNSEFLICPQLYSIDNEELIRAITLKTPILACHQPNLPQDLNDCLMPFSALDHNELSLKMLYLLKNKEEQDIYTELGQQRSQDYTWQNTTKQILDKLINI